ncbi:MAG: hypothetical protein U9R25_12370, partial [Chloroflexota bacterium]|nr:hypothetical protein [Chloroflexota bacterium]
EIGTPKDYTDDLYLVYFEVGEYQERAKAILESYLGEDRKVSIRTLAHGYIVEIALQSTPDIVKRLVDENIAVYQVNRLAKSDGRW